MSALVVLYLTRPIGTASIVVFGWRRRNQLVGELGGGYGAAVRYVVAHRIVKKREPAERSAGTADMSKLTPPQRAAIVERVKELNVKLQDPRLSMVRLNDLHKERAGLAKRLLEDSRRAVWATSPRPSAATPPTSSA